MPNENTITEIHTEIEFQNKNKYDGRIIQPFRNSTIQSLILDTITPVSDEIEHSKVMDRKEQAKPPTKKKGTNFKLLKACAFCQKRKRKCVVPLNSYKCEECIARVQECILDHKVVQPRARRLTRNNATLRDTSTNYLTESRIGPKNTLFSKKTLDITSKFPHISSAIEDNSNSLQADLVQNSEYLVIGSIAQREESRYEQKRNIYLRNEENLPTDNFSFSPCLPMDKLNHLTSTTQDETNVTGNSPSLGEYASVWTDQFTMVGSSRREEIGILSLNIYKTHVEPYTPFVLYDMFNSSDSGYLDHFSKFCIHVASVSSSTNQIPLGNTDLLFEVLKGYMENDNRYIFNEITLSCFLLLPLRIRISDNIVQKHLRRFNKFYEEKGNSLPINLLVGALTVDAFYSLFEGKWTLTTNTSILAVVSSYLGTLNKGCFNYHFLSVACFLYKLIMIVSNINLSYEEQRLAMLHLEYDMLLWPAKLTRELSVVEDDT